MPCVEQDAMKSRYAKMTAIGRRGTSEFQTPRCLVRKVPRVTSLATPQMFTFLCWCSQTGYESREERQPEVMARPKFNWR